MEIWENITNYNDLYQVSNLGRVKSFKGKKEKEHRKKVAARNQKIDAQKNAMQKIFDESMKKQLEDLKKQYDAVKTGGEKPTA